MVSALTKYSMATTQFLSLQNPVAFRKVFAGEKNQDILIHFLNNIIKFPAPIKKVTFVVDLYEVSCGLLCVLKTRCQWRMLPSDFPKWGTVHAYFQS